jgi:hypothetical protein
VSPRLPRQPDVCLAEHPFPGVCMALSAATPAQLGADRAACSDAASERIPGGGRAAGASKLAHYLDAARGRLVPLPAECVPRPAYLSAVRQGVQRVALAQLRTGSHWLAEETGSWARVPREQRACPHCQGCVEDVQPVLCLCPLHSPLRARFPDLLFEPTVHALMQQTPVLVAAFAAECQRTHAAAAATGPEEAVASGADSE